MEETTHLYSHGNVLLTDIMVVLVGVQHYNRISQSKSCVVGHERRAIDLLQGHKV